MDLESPIVDRKVLNQVVNLDEPKTVKDSHRKSTRATKKRDAQQAGIVTSTHEVETKKMKFSKQ